MADQTEWEAAGTGRTTRDRKQRPFVGLEEAARRLGYDATDWRAAARAFPVRWPADYLHLAEGVDGEPLRRIGVPDVAELRADAGDLADPVGEAGRSPRPFIVRKHADRALVLVTARCHFYCRFCFRRTSPGGPDGEPTAAQLDAALDDLLRDPELREVILSGGDPLVLEDGRLAALVRRVGSAAQVTRLRVHTRAPVHFPQRVTEALARILVAGKPCRVVTHFDHPLELTPASLAAVERLRRGGAEVLNQSVLLRGVNDDAEVLERLFRGLQAAGVAPHHLHHPDRAAGNAAFRLTIPRGLAIHAALRDRLPASALPSYVIDLPDGSGKVPVASLVRHAPGRWARPDGSSAFDDIPEGAR